jgi:hypothetical protein
MRPPIRFEPLDQGFSEPPPASLDGLPESSSCGEDLAHLHPDTPVREPTKAIVPLTIADLPRDLIGDGFHIEPTCHRRQLPVPGMFTGGYLAIEIESPSLKFSPGRTDYGPAVALDHEGRPGRVPLSVFHPTDKLVPDHASLTTAEVAPGSCQ